MERKTLKLLAVIGALCLMALQLQAQVTIGSSIEPRRAALLDLKTRQGAAGTVSSVTDPDNVTSEAGGLLLPRVMLNDVSSLRPLMSDQEVSDEELADPDFKLHLAGLMVYNINDNSLSGGTLFPAVYTWNGIGWVTSHINDAVSSIQTQPAKFTFYEAGVWSSGLLHLPLTFVVNGPGMWEYQWYQITGSNLHVRIGTVLGEPGTIYSTIVDAQADGSKSPSFLPNKVLICPTTYANCTGFYRFYCVAKSDLGVELISDIAEVAVGCGAKTNAGEWRSFMCFNLGATQLTIADQRDQILSPNASLHTENPDEQNIYGSLFQWGRIADNHELRSSAPVDISGLTDSNIDNGFLCTPYDAYPTQQVKNDSGSATWYGKFIYGAENWTPVAQGTADLLWRSGRYRPNDPCAHYKTDGTYQAFWATGSGSDACVDADTNWRTPSQEEWGELFRGSTHSGSPATATANTWEWSSANGRGYEIKPDGVKTTLFLPASGTRSIVAADNGQFYKQGLEGGYWSVGISGTLAYSLNFDEYNVNPATGSYRAAGFAIRCIKDF